MLQPSGLSIRMAAGFAEVAERKEILVAGLQPSEFASHTIQRRVDPRGLRLTPQNEPVQLPLQKM
jgi:hypothetical protein